MEPQEEPRNPQDDFQCAQELMIVDEVLVENVYANRLFNRVKSLTIVHRHAQEFVILLFKSPYLRFQVRHRLSSRRFHLRWRGRPNNSHHTEDWMELITLLLFPLIQIGFWLVKRRPVELFRRWSYLGFGWMPMEFPLNWRQAARKPSTLFGSKRGYHHGRWRWRPSWSRQRWIKKFDYNTHVYCSSSSTSPWAHVISSKCQSPITTQTS
jgi:hypothetical protein